VTVTMSEVAPPVVLPSVSAGKVYEFTPHGTRFKSAAKISIKYSGSATSKKMTVLRLADDKDTSWEPVGGAKFANGYATFESTTFSYYTVVTGYDCTPENDTVACSTGCNCCGGASCVDVSNDPKNCGACGNACAAGTFCSSGSSCKSVATTRLCDNSSLVVINGELPDLAVVSAEQTRDPASAQSIANALGAQCNKTPVTVSQAGEGVLDACTDAPLYKSGTTIVLVGGSFSQRLAGYLNQSLEPVVLQDTGNGGYAFDTRGGSRLVAITGAQLTPSHDYFLVTLVPDPTRGALILHVYGVGWEGTPAAVYYFSSKILPEAAAGTRSWKSYLLVEWTDNGDGQKGAGDTFNVIAKD
jgi:hypothetical protein